jgi:hypothetical protein
MKYQVLQIALIAGLDVETQLPVSWKHSSSLPRAATIAFQMD